MTQSSSATALRLIKTLQLIPRHSASSRRRIGTRQLKAALEKLGFQISERSLQRNLKDLQQLFPDLCNDGNRDALGWYWKEQAVPLDIPAMDASMALSFEVAHHFLSPAMPSLMQRLQPYLDVASRLLDAASPDWLEKIHVEPRSMPLQPAKVDESAMDIVYTALINEKRIRGRYRPRNGPVAEYELSPRGLVLRHEVSYLVATTWDYEDLRHYALHRFVPGSLELLDTAIQPLENFDLQSYIEEGGFHYRIGVQPLRLRLKMKTGTAAHLAETPLAENQKMKSIDDDWVRIEASVSSTRQLRWWLLGLGDQVVVEAPETLRQEIQLDLQQALDGYDSPIQLQNKT